MPIVISTPPTIEPITVADAKEHLRIIEDDDDGYISALIQAARELIEAETKRSLITQTVKQYRNSFPCASEILLERGPVQSTAVTYVDTNGATQTLSTDVYALKNEGMPPKLSLKDDQSWPTDLDESGNAVCITSVCGYGATAASVPMRLRLAIKLLVSWWYSNRMPVNIGASISELPHSFEALVGPLRVYMPGEP